MAGEWLLVLRERPEDPALQASFAAWLAADPAHAEDWRQVERTYDLLGLALGPDAGRAAAPRTSWRSRAAAAWLPLAGVAALAAFIVLQGGWPGAARHDYATATGELLTVDLEDGSRVHLAPQAAIDVDFSGAERRVGLAHGAAFFEIARDPGRPFQVAGSHAAVTVTGTAFEVHERAAATSVAVREGAVRLLPRGGGAELLGAGDWVEVSAGRELARGHMPADHVAAWLDGELIVDERPLGAVVDDIRPYFQGYVLLYGDGLEAQPLTGLYRLSDAENALRAVAAAYDATVFRLTPWILVIAGHEARS